MKEKFKNIFKKNAPWVKIAGFAVVLGISIQFVRAGIVGPTGSPAATNVTAPILTTGGQAIDGTLSVKGTLTVDRLVVNKKATDNTNGYINLNDEKRETWPTSTTTTPTSPYTPGTWFNDQLKFDWTNQRGNSWSGWVPVTTDVNKKTMVLAHAVNKIRVRGYADGPGYCYAYANAGTGHSFTYYDNGTSGEDCVYNVDNSLHRAMTYYSYSPCLPGEIATLIPGGCGDGCDNWECTSVMPDYVKVPSADDRGSANICLNVRAYGTIPADIQTVDIPAGATLTLEGRNTTNEDPSAIQCAMDFQYAP
jgi:hypothetical protein